MRARLGPALAMLLLLAALGTGCATLLQPYGAPDAGQIAEAGGADRVLVRVAACWAAEPLARELLEAFGTENPQLAFDLLLGNSEVAAAAVAGGQADLALVSAEQPLAPGLRSRAVAVDGIALAAHPDLPLEGLSLAALRDLYAGRHLDWEELGAGPVPVHLIGREEGSGTRAAFARQVMAGEGLATTAVVVPHDRAVLEQAAEEPGAIGYVSLAQAGEAARLLRIDGVAPTQAELRRERYPLRQEIVAVTPANPTREASRLLAYLLSARGRQLVGRRYALP